MQNESYCACGCGEVIEPKPSHRYRPVQYKIGHNHRKSVVEYVTDVDTGCWIWQRARTGNGYGAIRREGKFLQAHRVYYERFVGPIPEGLFLDHLCRNPACVNPTHLEPVTSGENTLRGTGWAAVNAAKTHCLRGHAFTPENTRVNRKGHRICKTCARERCRR